MNGLKLNGKGNAQGLWIAATRVVIDGETAKIDKMVGEEWRLQTN